MWSSIKDYFNYFNIISTSETHAADQTRPGQSKQGSANVQSPGATPAPLAPTPPRIAHPTAALLRNHLGNLAGRDRPDVAPTAGLTLPSPIAAPSPVSRLYPPLSSATNSVQPSSAGGPTPFGEGGAKIVGTADRLTAQTKHVHGKWKDLVGAHVADDSASTDRPKGIAGHANADPATATSAHTSPTSLPDPKSFAHLDLEALKILLTDKEYKALESYIQNGAGLSHSMRNDIPLSSGQREMLEDILSAIKKIRDQGGSAKQLLHRGMAADVARNDRQHTKLFREGVPFEERGLMSTSTDAKFAHSWQDGIELVVSSVSNADITAMNPAQNEALCEPATYDVLIAAEGKNNIFKAVIEEQGTPEERGKASRHQAGYDRHLMRPEHDPSKVSNLVNGLPAQHSVDEQRTQLVMSLTLALNSTLTPTQLRQTLGAVFPAANIFSPNPVMSQIRALLRQGITHRTPVEITNVLSSHLGTPEMKKILAALDAKIQHLKPGLAERLQAPESTP